MLSRFGQKECSCLALVEHFQHKVGLGWRVFHLKSLLDARMNKEVKDMTLILAVSSKDGPLSYVKQICGPIIKIQT